MNTEQHTQPSEPRLSTGLYLGQLAAVKVHADRVEFAYEVVSYLSDPDEGGEGVAVRGAPVRIVSWWPTDPLGWALTFHFLYTTEGDGPMLLECEHDGDGYRWSIVGRELPTESCASGHEALAAYSETVRRWADEPKREWVVLVPEGGE